LFISESDYHHYRNVGLKGQLPDDLESNPQASIVPASSNTPAPPTVENPDRKLRYISLAECIAIALEMGNTGSTNLQFPGSGNDALITFNGRFVGPIDSIRVLSLDPAITGADIESALSKFDAQFISSMTWSKRDDAIQNALSNLQNGDIANLDLGIYKPLPTGGLAGISYTTDYSKLGSPPAQFAVINPSYRPRVTFRFEQPLLQNYGVEVNQLLSSHPGSVTVAGLRPSGGRTEGILITRIRLEQSRAEFERNINFMLLNIEVAYWNLYASYGTLHARDEALIDAVDLWRVVQDRKRVGFLADQDEARVRAQLESFRAQRISALADVIEKERQLRLLLGLPIEDGCRLVPSDTPSLAPFNPDWCQALAEAHSHRPELYIARQDLKFRQLDVMLQKNFLRPDLRFVANYDINGIGTRLDGSETMPNGINPTTGALNVEPHNALASLANNDFNSWQLGLRLNIPIGFRDAHAAVRVARLNLARSYVSLKDQERKAEFQLALQYQRLYEFQGLIRAQQAQASAAEKQRKALEQLRDQTNKLDQLLEQILNAQRTKVEARAAEFQAVSSYNGALAGFQFAKGTLMSYDNVHIADGPLPVAAQRRAVDHERERTAAVVLRERAASEATNRMPSMARVIQTPPTMMHPVENGIAPDAGNLGQPAMMPNVPVQPIGPGGPMTPPPMGSGPAGTGMPVSGFANPMSMLGQPRYTNPR
jgi:outer membrane protein TolC